MPKERECVCEGIGSSSMLRLIVRRVVSLVDMFPTLDFLDLFILLVDKSRATEYISRVVGE